MTAKLLAGINCKAKASTGAPAAGTWAVGDLVCDSAGTYYVCTVAGTPGTWVALTTGAGISDGDKGDITVSASGATWTIDSGVVTLAKMANLAQFRLIGRYSSGTGVPEAITIASPISTAGGVLKNLSGYAANITMPSGSAITTTATAVIETLHLVSGTAGDYTITLPDVAFNSGMSIGFVVKDWTAANKQYTLDAGVGVKIAGNTRYLVLCHTNVVLLYSDGTSWHPLVMCLDTPWVDGGAVTPAATTTNPTVGTTTVNKMWWKRTGDSAQFRYEYVQSSGGTNGSGTYLIPFIFTADTAKINVTATGTVDQSRNSVGCGTVASRIAHVMLYDSTRVYAQITNDVASSLWAAANAQWSGANYFQLNFTLPITNW